MTDSPEPVKYLVPGLEKGLRLLLEFGRQRQELNFATICQRVGMSKSTTFRTLQTLEQMGFLTRHPQSGLYRLGVGVLRLGFDYLASLDFVQYGQPIIQRLCNELGASTHLAVLDGRDVLYVARMAAAGELSSGVNIGSRLPAHCTALGRILLFSISAEDYQARYPEAVFEHTGAQSPRTPAALWALLEQDRQLGHVVSQSFYQPGICTVAYPLRNAQCQVVAAISAMVPGYRLEPGRCLQLEQALASAVTEIEAYLHASAPPALAAGGGHPGSEVRHA